jgi:hypothetical protein
MMEAASTSGTSVNFFQTTRRYNPEDSHLQLTVSMEMVSLLCEFHVVIVFHFMIQPRKIRLAVYLARIGR